MQIIELMEIWRSGRFAGSTTALSSDEYPEVVALLPESELMAGDQICPLIAGNRQ